jgi:hypothetical protein
MGINWVCYINFKNSPAETFLKAPIKAVYFLHLFNQSHNNTKVYTIYILISKKKILKHNAFIIVSWFNTKILTSFDPIFSHQFFLFFWGKRVDRHYFLMLKCIVPNCKRKKSKVQSEGFQSAKNASHCKKGIMFIWPERNNILDFGALHFGIIKSSDDKVVIRIYPLASRKSHLSVY